MKLIHLKLQHFRNFDELNLHFHPRINLILGANGTGKTNLLEAIYHLGTGKSFRTTLSNRIIQNNYQTSQIYGCVQNNELLSHIGIQRHLNAPTLLYFNQAHVTNTGELITAFPFRLINPDSFNLLLGGPKFRRQLLNWGAFHVEPLFWSTWQNYNRILKQRNAALKKGLRNLIRSWDAQLVQQAEALLPLYQSYFELFKTLFHKIMLNFLPTFDIELRFFPGWDQSKSLFELLEANYPKDQAQARTHAGPHRADLRIKIGTIYAKDILSRGQQKLVVCSLLLAQGILLKEHFSRSCAYLLDDLGAELDSSNLKLICSFLEEIDAQVFLTSTDNKIASSLFCSDKMQSFHVEQLHKEVAKIL